MPGAGGILAMNYLYNTAEKDGTVIGLVQNNTPLEPLFGTKPARYDATKFNWLGTPSFEVRLVLVWNTVPVNTVEDLQDAGDHHGRVGRELARRRSSAADQRDARHQDEADQRLSRAERHLPRDGARRARRLSRACSTPR